MNGGNNLQRRLRTKFIALSVASFTVVMVIIIIAINVITAVKIDSHNNNILTALSENGGDFPQKEEYEKYDFDGFAFGSEMPYSTRYFAVITDMFGKVVDVRMRHIASVTRDEAVKMALGVLPGHRSAYRDVNETAETLNAETDSNTRRENDFCYIVSFYGDGYIAVFLDVARDNYIKSTLMVASVTAGVISVLLVSAAVSLLSGTAIRPFVKTVEAQKRFVADVSHELKTPIAIISADTEVLELDVPENEWLVSIKHQVKRMSSLISDMLTLVRAEDPSSLRNIEDIDLSAAVDEITYSMRSLAEEKGRHFETYIESGITVRGEYDKIYELLSILFENMIKHSVGDKLIVSLEKSGRDAVIKTRNACGQIDSPERLFDRFYRADASRERSSGGFGIGLSVAKAVAEAHGGKINAQVCDGYITFTVTLPL